MSAVRLEQFLTAMDFGSKEPEPGDPLGLEVMTELSASLLSRQDHNDGAWFSVLLLIEPRVVDAPLGYRACGLLRIQPPGPRGVPPAGISAVRRCG